MKEDNRIIEKRITALEVKLEVKVDEIEKHLLNIENNHLPTINRKLDNQKNWQIGIMTALILNLVGVIIMLVAK